jgi:hypothetical protein
MHPDRQGFEVGDRCPFTNEPVGDTTVEVEIAGPNEGSPPRLVRIRLPMLVSPSWKGAALEGKKRIGRWVFRIGAAVLLVGIAVLVALSQLYPQGGAPPWMMVASSVPLGLGLIAAVVGLAWPYLEGVPGPGGALEASQIGRRYIFLRGAHPKYLSSLPAWTGESRYQFASALDRWAAIGMTAVGAFFLLAGLFFLVAGIRARQLSAATVNWPTTPGVIISSTVTESTIPTRRGPQTNYYAMVTFKYAVGGTEYQSERVKYSGAPSSTDPTSAQAVVGRYPAGQAVQIYYAPHDPSYGILEPGIDENAASIVVLAAMGFVGMFAFPAGVWLLRRTRKRAAQVASELA